MRPVSCWEKLAGSKGSLISVTMVTQITPFHFQFQRGPIWFWVQRIFYRMFLLISGHCYYLLLGLSKPSKRYQKALAWLVDMEEITTWTPKYFRLILLHPCWPRGSPLNKFLSKKGFPTHSNRRPPQSNFTPYKILYWLLWYIEFLGHLISG